MQCFSSMTVTRMVNWPWKNFKILWHTKILLLAENNNNFHLHFYILMYTQRFIVTCLKQPEFFTIHNTCVINECLQVAGLFKTDDIIQIQSIYIVRSDPVGSITILTISICIVFVFIKQQRPRYSRLGMWRVLLSPDWFITIWLKRKLDSIRSKEDIKEPKSIMRALF